MPQVPDGNPLPDYGIVDFITAVIILIVFIGYYLYDLWKKKKELK